MNLERCNKEGILDGEKEKHFFFQREKRMNDLTDMNETHRTYRNVCVKQYIVRLTRYTTNIFRFECNNESFFHSHIPPF